MVETRRRGRERERKEGFVCPRRRVNNTWSGRWRTERAHQGTRRTLFSSVGVQGLEARWHSRVICWTFNLFYLKEASASLSHKKPQSHPDTRTRWNGKSFLIRGQGVNFHPWRKEIEGEELDYWLVLREIGVLWWFGNFVIFFSF